VSRARAERRGRVAEWAAVIFLMCKGYRILGHRLRTPYGEVDVAAWKSGVLVIVEVKARIRMTPALMRSRPWRNNASRAPHKRLPAAGGSPARRSALTW
jgi:hypothetical protein